MTISFPFVSDAAARPNLIFLPCSAMALWTVTHVLRLGLTRYAAVKGKRVKAAYYALYQTEAGGGEPVDLAKLSQHVENLFEAPPLFYAACVALHQLRGVNPFTVSLAWAYFLARVFHTLEHTGRNHVFYRFIAYASSTVILGTLWAVVATHAL